MMQKNLPKPSGTFITLFDLVYTRETLVVDSYVMNFNTITLYKKENNVVINSGTATFLV